MTGKTKYRAIDGFASAKWLAIVGQGPAKMLKLGESLSSCNKDLRRGSGISNSM